MSLPEAGMLRPWEKNPHLLGMSTSQALLRCEEHTHGSCSSKKLRTESRCFWLKQRTARSFRFSHFCSMLGGLYPAEQGTLKRLMEKKMTEGHESFNDTEKESYGRLIVKAEQWEVKELQDELKQELKEKDEEVPPVEIQTESEAKQNACAECSIL